MKQTAWYARRYAFGLRTADAQGKHAFRVDAQGSTSTSRTRSCSAWLDKWLA